MNEIQQSLRRFLEAIKSPVTKKGYRLGLDKFLAFAQIKDYDALASTEPEILEKLIESYILFLKEKYNKGELRSSSFNAMIAPIELFFQQNKIIIGFKRLKRMFPPKQVQTGQAPFTTNDIARMLNSTSSKRWKAVIHVLASTGMRPGGLLGLKISDIEPLEDGYASVRIYSGEPESYWNFLTPEAYAAVKDYLDNRKMNGEIITRDSPLFRNNYQKDMACMEVKKMSSTILYERMAKIQEAAGIRQRRSSFRDRHEVRIFYGFRKRWNTIMKLNNLLNHNITEKLMGHKRGLDGVYFQPTKDQCFTEFKKGAVNLMIDDNHRKKMEIDRLKSDNENLQKKVPDLVNQAKERIMERLRLEGCIVDFDRDLTLPTI